MDDTKKQERKELLESFVNNRNKDDIDDINSENNLTPQNNVSGEDLSPIAQERRPKKQDNEFSLSLKKDRQKELERKKLDQEIQSKKV